jgi:lysophospholipase L1-like esterase
VSNPDEQCAGTELLSEPAFFFSFFTDHCPMKNSIIISIFILVAAGCSGPEQAAQTARSIIFFGDSITEQGEKPGGYVSLVRESLTSSGAGYDVIGAGISGHKITDLLARAERDVISKKPSIVVIYIGINDVWHYEFASRGLSGTPKEKFESGLQELIGRLHDAGARTVLCTPSVIGEKLKGANKYDALLDEYSAISRSVASRTGSVLCDLRTAFLDQLQSSNPADSASGILTTDGVHLNDAGNRFVADHMLKTLDGMGIFFPAK